MLYVNFVKISFLLFFRLIHSGVSTMNPIELICTLPYLATLCIAFAYRYRQHHHQQLQSNVQQFVTANYNFWLE